ncbi:MAG: hypothetical protein K2P27_01135, partial [Lachnospiraceae bacterium]|nr:hypothetical protein [Lachnospiraceae bacterium]
MLAGIKESEHERCKKRHQKYPVLLEEEPPFRRGVSGDRGDPGVHGVYPGKCRRRHRGDRQEDGWTLTIRVRDERAFSYDQDIYYPRELVRELESWEEVKGLDYLALANARGVDVKEVFSETQQSFQGASEEMGVDYYGSEAERNAGQITVIGSNDLEKTWKFKKRGAEVTEGECISPENASQALAVVSERFLEWNMLKIG